MADAWLWHPTDGKRLFPDMTPAYQKQLEDEGWRDSPDKVSPSSEGANEVPNIPSEKLGTEKTIHTKSTDIRDVGIDDFLAGGDILSSAAALGRFGLFFDPDGDRKRDDISDELLTQTVDAMSRDEVAAALSQAGGGSFIPTAWTYQMRAALLRQLAPGKDFAAFPGYDRPGDAFAAEKADIGGDANVDERSAPNTAVGNGDGLASAEEKARPIDPPLKSDGADALIPAVGAAEITTNAAPGADEAKRLEAEDIATLVAAGDKADLQKWLDDHRVSYKARDGKDELIALVKKHANAAE